MKVLINLIFKLDINSLFFKETDNDVIKFFRYFFVGGISAVVELIIFTLFVYIMKTDNDVIRVLISNTLGFLGGLTTNYILSKKFVFTEKSIASNKIVEFIWYGIIGIVGLLISTVLIVLFMRLIGLNEFFSKIIATILVFIYNYFARKILLYKK